MGFNLWFKGLNKSSGGEGVLTDTFEKQA